MNSSRSAVRSRSRSSVVVSVPEIRIQPCNTAPVRPEGDYVLYWMTAFRRLGWNFALQRAAECARELGKPLVVFEALRAGYPWASERFDRFVMDGMAVHERKLAKSDVLYFPYVEPAPGKGRGLLEALASRACLVVADDYPGFFLPRMVSAAARKLKVRMEKVDSNGLLPLRAADRDFTAAFHFRRFLQKTLPYHLASFPEEDPLAAPLPRRLPGLPPEILRRWPPAVLQGGEQAGSAVLERFLEERLAGYGEGRNHPDEEMSSGLSPYLHFGQVSPHQVFAAVASWEEWSPERLGQGARGAVEGWWGMSPAAEKFLDEAVTWREIGYNMAFHRPDFDLYESLPDWARQTLAKHEDDPRPHLYPLEQLEAAETHDPVWNAAQTQLVREGRIHNYLRMLWGKKILHWSATPRRALAVLIELNNKYALDGRDPNSYTGIFWCLGRYDRPWAPERPVFGSVRYMSTESTLRKLRLERYLERYG